MVFPLKRSFIENIFSILLQTENFFDMEVKFLMKTTCVLELESSVKEILGVQKESASKILFKFCANISRAAFVQESRANDSVLLD